MNLLSVLREEKQSGLKGGIYHKTQIKLAYNTNRIEGSQLSEEQTRYIYETNTVFLEKGETTANVDEILSKRLITSHALIICSTLQKSLYRKNKSKNFITC